MKNKKGISAIVATVLIILITVAAVTIIWAAIIPMIQNQIGGSTECFAAEAAISVVSAYTCYDAVSDNLSIQVRRGVGDYELAGIEVFWSSQGTSNSTLYSLAEAPKENEDKVFVITGVTAVDSVAVAAKIRTGSAEKACSKSGMVSIGPCAA